MCPYYFRRLCSYVAPLLTFVTQYSANCENGTGRPKYQTLLPLPNFRTKAEIEFISDGFFRCPNLIHEHTNMGLVQQKLSGMNPLITLQFILIGQKEDLLRAVFAVQVPHTVPQSAHEIRETTEREILLHPNPHVNCAKRQNSTAHLPYSDPLHTVACNDSSAVARLSGQFALFDTILMGPHALVVLSLPKWNTEVITTTKITKRWGFDHNNKHGMMLY